MNDLIGAIKVSTPVESTATTDADRARLEQAARDFEAILVNQMMKAMRATLPKDGIFGDNSKIRMYEELRDEELSKIVAKQKGLGLAELLVEQLARSDVKTLEEFESLRRGPSEAAAAYAIEAQKTGIGGK